MPLPFISCICPTFGRLPESQYLVEEAIESYLRQDYPQDHSELLVLNDCPQQQLMCDSPGVTVINIPRRFNSLGEKYNAMVGLAKGQLICPWEDDDISLPWRLSMSAHALTTHTVEYYNPRCYWLWLNGYGRHQNGVGHNCSMYTRYIWAEVGGYKPISGAQDLLFDQAVRETARFYRGPDLGSIELSQEFWFYILRWDSPSYHLSGALNTESFYYEMGSRVVVPGVYTLKPSWRSDYVADTRAALKHEP